jgi:hypothetical protein
MIELIIILIGTGLLSVVINYLERRSISDGKR